MSCPFACSFWQCTQRTSRQPRQYRLQSVILDCLLLLAGCFEQRAKRSFFADASSKGSTQGGPVAGPSLLRSVCSRAGGVLLLSFKALITEPLGLPLLCFFLCFFAGGGVPSASSLPRGSFSKACPSHGKEGLSASSASSSADSGGRSNSRASLAGTSQGAMCSAIVSDPGQAVH